MNTNTTSNSSEQQEHEHVKGWDENGNPYIETTFDNGAVLRLTALDPEATRIEARCVDAAGNLAWKSIAPDDFRK